MAMQRPPRMRHAAVAVLSVVLLTARARADEPVSQLVVERTEGAEECPDVQELAARVQRIRERTDLGRAAYRVTFSRGPTGLGVSITAEPSGRARMLTSGDATCDAIANAAAVTLALLFDAEPAAPPARPAPPAPDRAPLKPKEPSAPRPATTRLDATLAASFVSLAGVTSPVAFGGALEAGLVTPRFRTSLGALLTAKVHTALGPGDVAQGLVGATARGCVAAVTGSPRLDACTGAIVGVTSATASGYSRNETRQRPWLAIPVELAGSLWTRRFGVELGVAALFPAVRHDFGIDGLGVPYRSSAVAGMASLRFIVTLPL